jgi:hypothetical protein
MKLSLRLLQLLLICFLTFQISAQKLYTGFQGAGSDGYYLYGGLTWSALVSTWQTLGSQNQGLIDVSTYIKNG